MVKMATEIGVTTKQLAVFNAGAKLTDVSVEAMDTGLVRFGKTIAAVRGGGSKEAAALFQHLGISLKDSAGHARGVADLMPQLAEAFKNTSDPAMRIRMAMTLMGRGGAEMIPMLVGGKAALEDFAAVAAKVNYAPSADEAEGLERFHRGWIELQMAVTGFMTEVGSKLAPVLNPIIAMTKDWIVANRDWIATNITDAISGFSDVVKSIYPFVRDVARSLWDAGGAVNALLAPIGGVTTVFYGLGAAMLALTVITWAKRTQLAGDLGDRCGGLVDRLHHRVEDRATGHQYWIL